MMKKESFNCDIKDILRELNTNDEYSEILSYKFAYTYLIFDCDAHNTERGTPKKASIDDIVKDNFVKLSEMAEYFTDETDPTIGKLYINYPMMESYKDCSDFFDNNYKTKTVSIDHLKNYKSIVGQQKFASKRVDKYQKEDFKQLIKMNVFKLNEISTHNWSPMKYKDYCKIGTSINVLNKEKTLIEKNRVISVLNTSLFLLIDYYGNQKGFYDDVVNN